MLNKYIYNIPKKFLSSILWGWVISRKWKAVGATKLLDENKLPSTAETNGAN